MHAEAIPHTPDVNLGPFPLSGGAPKELRPPETVLPTRPSSGRGHRSGGAPGRPGLLATRGALATMSSDPGIEDTWAKSAAMRRSEG